MATVTQAQAPAGQRISLLRLLTMNTSKEVGGRDVPLWRQILLQVFTLIIAAGGLISDHVHHDAVRSVQRLHAPHLWN